MTTAVKPAPAAPVTQRAIRVTSWVAQGVVALALAFGASRTTRPVAILLAAAAVGVLIASGVGLGLWAERGGNGGERR